MQLNLKYTFDKNLHEKLENPQDVEIHVKNLIECLARTSGEERVKHLGEVGVFLRMLGRLEEAKKYLEEALELLKSSDQNSLHVIRQKLRLAHVYQWQQNFNQSNQIFKEILDGTQNEKNAEIIDFIWQHAGKNLFDQGRYKEALDFFKKALSLRIDKSAPADLIKSSQDSTLETLNRLK